MDYQAFLDQTQTLTQESEDFFVSPDFQCDQTGGYPTYVCVAWDFGKAWLDLNSSLDSPGENREVYDRMCAEFGIHRCEDVEQYHALLEELGEDAVSNAYLPEENEGMNLQ
ncbi:MAG: hypothetical protein IJ112_06105 [Oscillospiraceae bacterium]|nr:hypothetical protein [Oscillospiraceae bacterium]